MFRRKQADQIPADYLGYLDAAVKMILDQGLAVILDIHPDSDFKEKLATENEFVEQFADFWRALARHYATLDAENVFFEVLNEPEFRDRYRWEGVQSKLAAAIREGAQAQTIIVAGANWSADNELLFIEPLRDPNIIYNFHFYDPHVFTHQGATWSTNYVHYLKDLPYQPSRPDGACQMPRGRTFWTTIPPCRPPSGPTSRMILRHCIGWTRHASRQGFHTPKQHCGIF